jgi:hypothetical protein
MRKFGLVQRRVQRESETLFEADASQPCKKEIIKTVEENNLVHPQLVLQIV